MKRAAWSCVLALLWAGELAAQAGPALERARELYRQHRYSNAQAVVDSVLRREPGHADALYERGRLLIRAWRLDAADSLAARLPGVRGSILHGRVELLRKHYDAALEAARTAQRREPHNAEAYRLEADVHFWREQPELAEAPLRRALELAPDDADARFAYGYAIWRRVDARELPAMAAEWNRALGADPLHYETHWHFGNGHTHLTYADYAQPADSIVRLRILSIDSLVAQENVASALARTRALEAEYPESLLPALTRASIFYMAHGLPRAERLDSAQAIFQGLLARKPNYGPAHNGLAAVIKQRQFEYVANYDSLEAAIAAEPLPADRDFTRVFKDLAYYPGDRVERMARQQLGPSLAYLPFLARLGYTYTVPPLHRDLAEAVGNRFFRSATTFDNRQWMDIRGVGGNHAAAGIEYVERGSHQERVVLLHEYVHQWHGSVLTDRENRRIRQLYYDAMAGNRTLDYYAANNESEFFAQSYEAYLTPVKVHPLNHKSMNTTADLLRRDPALYAFLDSLIAKNRAYLAGDTAVMRGNWAQVYVTLASRARTRARTVSDEAVSWPDVHALLDTALAHDARYQPAWLERAAALQAQRRWREAEAALARAEAIDPAYAPVQVARAALLAARAAADEKRVDANRQIELYRRALELEADLAERASLSRSLGELLYDDARMPAAIAVAENYAREEPTPSTYLRDARDRALAFAAGLRAEAGYADSVTAFFAELVARKPQHYDLRAQAARALLHADRPADAARLIEEGLRVLRAARQRRPDYTILLATALEQQSLADSARAIISEIEPSEWARLGPTDRLALARVLARSGALEKAAQEIPADTAWLAPRVRAERLHAAAILASGRGDREAQLALDRRALALNPYHVAARVALVRALEGAGRRRDARRVREDARRLPLPLGPAYWRAVGP